MGRETVYSSGLTEDEIRQWERDFRAYFGPNSESSEELERSWQEGPGKNPPLPRLRQRFRIAADDDRLYIFLSRKAENAFCLDEMEPRACLPFFVAVDPGMTGRDIVRGLLGRRATDLKEFGLVCLGKEITCTMGGFSINLAKHLRESMGIEQNRPVSETGIRLTPL